MEVYKFKVIKSPESSKEEFERALDCARVCVESIFGTELLTVDVVGNTISIRHADSEEPIDITLFECKEKIKGCFCEDTGIIYPEFIKVIPE